MDTVGDLNQTAADSQPAAKVDTVNDTNVQLEVSPEPAEITTVTESSKVYLSESAESSREPETASSVDGSHLDSPEDCIHPEGELVRHASQTQVSTIDTPTVEKQLYLKFPDLKSVMQKKRQKDVYLDACRNLGVLIPCSKFSANQKCSTLSLRYHGLSPQDPLAILQNNLTLERLDICGNGICSGGKGLAELLVTNTSLTHLILSHCQLTSDSLLALASMLQENSTLVHLDLSGNNLNDLHATKLAEALKVNNVLGHLKLAHNETGDIGALNLGQALATKHVLKTLDLSYNQISVTGVNAFCSYAKENGSLQELRLSSNELGGNCGTALSQFIARSESLCTLELCHTQINDTVVQSLCRVIDLKASLRNLDISENPLTDTSIVTVLKTIQPLNWSSLKLKHLQLSESSKMKLREFRNVKADVQIDV